MITSSHRIVPIGRDKLKIEANQVESINNMIKIKIHFWSTLYFGFNSKMSFKTKRISLG